MEAGRRFIDALKMFYHVANIGDARCLAIHPASTTHSQLTPEEQLQTGVTDGYVRLSIGIEHEDDILADLTQALEAADPRRAAGGARTRWPIDLGLTVASHGWVHLEPWRWEAEAAGSPAPSGSATGSAR